MCGEQFFNFFINCDVKNFAIVNQHTILGEEATGAIMSAFAIISIRIIVNSYIANNSRVILIKFLNSILLSLTLHFGTNAVAQILDIVFDIKPLIHIGLFKINAIRNSNITIYKVLSFYANNIRNLVIIMTQIYSSNKAVSSLRLAGRELKLFKSLVIVEQNSLRTANDLSFAVLRNNIYRVASPYINTYNTIKLIIKGNGARLSIRSTTRNVSFCFQISESRVNRIRSHIGESIQINRLKGLLNCLFIKTSIMLKGVHIAGIPQFALTSSKFTLYYNLSSRIGQIHSRALDSSNFTGHAVHNIATFAFGNRNSMMSNLVIIINNRMLGTRVINHLGIASDKLLFAYGVNSAIFILIFSDYLNINTGNLRKFDSTENTTALGRAYESFSRLREYHSRTMDIALVAIFVFKDTIFKTLKGYSVTHITILFIVLKRNDFNTSRRNIKRYLGALNYKDLTVNIGMVCLNRLSLSIKHFTLMLARRISFVYTSKQILVRAQRMALNSLCHLAGIERKANWSSNINFLTYLYIFGQVISARLRMLITLNRVLQNKVPVFRSRNKEINSFIITATFKSLSFSIKSHQFIRIGETGFRGAYPTYNMTFGFVEYISIFIYGKDKVLLHFAHLLTFLS